MTSHLCQNTLFIRCIESSNLVSFESRASSCCLVIEFKCASIATLEK